MRGVSVSENLQKLIGVVVMAVLVVVGVAVSSGDDTDFSRNAFFRSNPGTFAGADRVAEKDVESQILTSLGTLEYRTNNLEIALADLESAVADMAGNLETLLEVTSAGSPQVEAFADMITLLCVGDSTPLVESKIMRGLDLHGYYMLGELSQQDRFSRQWIITLDFKQCVAGWVLGMEPQKAQQVISHFGWSSIHGNSKILKCDPVSRRPGWNPLHETTQGDGHWIFELASEKNDNGRDVVNFVDFQKAWFGTCD